MVRLCEPGKTPAWALSGVLLAYLIATATIEANPANWPTHTASVAAQAANVAILGGLVAAVAAYNRRRGCGGKTTLTWITLMVLASNLAIRLASMAFLSAKGRGAANGEARFTRWDLASKAVGMVAVLAEVYYALVPNVRFRSTLFLCGLVFVLPVALSLARSAVTALGGGGGGMRHPKDELVAALGVCDAAYDAYDGKDHRTRVLVRVVNGVTYVGFAGTENATDAKVDADVRDSELPTTWLRAGEKARGHAGFVILYATIREAVKALLPPAGRVVFVGHSLGGALATLAALDVSSSSSSIDASVVTFGGPQVGDSNFVKLFDKRVAQCTRVVNPFDPVPKLMAAQLPHTRGYYAVASLTRDSPATAHLLDTYGLALSRPAWMSLLGRVAPASYVLAAAGGVGAYHYFMGRRQ